MFGDTLPATNIAPENRPSQKESQVSSIPTFQPSIFRCYVSFGECNVSVPSQALQPSHVCCSVRNGKGARYCSEAFPILGIDSFPKMEPYIWNINMDICNICNTWSVSLFTRT